MQRKPLPASVFADEENQAAAEAPATIDPGFGPVPFPRHINAYGRRDEVARQIAETPGLVAAMVEMGDPRISYFFKSQNRQEIITRLMWPAQLAGYRFLQGPQRYLNLVGGSRSGKTVLIVRAIIARAIEQASRHAILKFRSNSVWPSIGLDTFPKVMELFFPGTPYEANKQYGFFSLPVNGQPGKFSEIWLGGLDEKERVDKILGREYVSILLNECSQISYDAYLTAVSRLAQIVPDMKQRMYCDLNPTNKGHWTNKVFGEHIDPLDNKPLPNVEDYARMFLNPKDNPNLTPEYLRSLASMPARKRLRFFEGLYHDDTENALWSYDNIQRNRVKRAQVPDLVKVVVAIDPSGAASADDTGKDAIGIVVAGLGRDGKCYILKDATLLAGPTVWGRVAVEQYYIHKADRIVAETNYGGAMVEYVIKMTDQRVSFVEVKASRGKAVRAEPVSVLYHKDLVCHVEEMQELEDELLAFTDYGYIGEKSPNRADALVWAVTDLMLGENSAGWVEYYRRLYENGGETPEPMRDTRPTIDGVTPTQPASDRIDMLAPSPGWGLKASSGHFYESDKHGVLHGVRPGDVTALLAFGCKHMGKD